MALIHADETNFEKLVLEEPLPVLVDFWATWCGPCQMIAPIVEEIAAQTEGKAVVCKVDVDEAPALAEKYGVMSIPTLIVFKNGAVADQLIGLRPKEEILAILGL